MSEEGAPEVLSAQLVRVIFYKRNRTDALVTLYGVQQCSAGVLEEARKVLFGGFDEGDLDDAGALPLSLYEAPSRLADTTEHALGVIAVVLGNGPNFSDPPREDIPCKQLTTLFVEQGALCAAFEASRTEDQCMVFFPARELHWDLKHYPRDAMRASELTAHLIGCLSDADNVFDVLFDSKKAPAARQVAFSALATLALDRCCDHYGLTATEYDAERWGDSPNLSAQEQARRLRIIAAQRGYRWRDAG